MSDLGPTLAQARVDRGLTLEDCERDTRISKRYLNALEQEDWKVFPAPVYSRAFLRTYAQYLGLSPEQMMRAFQDSTAEPEITPLPEIKPPEPTGSMNWVLAGVVLLFLVVAGFFLYQSRDDDGDGETATSAAVTATIAAEQPGGGPANPALGRDPGPITRGEVPDLQGVRQDEAIAALAEAGLSYVIVEPDEGTDGTPGIVLSQDPAPGTKGSSDTAVTLVVPP